MPHATHSLPQRALAAALALLPAGLVQEPVRTQGEGAPQERTDALHATVEALAQDALAAGASALVVVVDVGGERLLSHGFGRTREGALPDGDTPIHVGALLTNFLAVAALDMAEDGRLELEASLATAFPELPYGELGVRVEHLLTHTSGIPSYGELLHTLHERATALTPERVLVWLRSGPLDATPESCARYSPTNDFLLGLVLERAAGKGLRALLETTLFEPAGMERTRFGCVAEMGALRFEQEFAGALEDQGDVPAPFDADELCSSAHDLLRFQRALVAGHLLSPAGLARRALPTRLADGTECAGARGLGLTKVGEFACQSVGGCLAGERVRLAYYPALDATIVVWARGEGAPVRQLSERLARTLLGLEAPALRDLATTPELRALHVGDYFAGCTSHAITDEQGHLVLYPPEGPRTVLLFQGGETFVARDDPDLRLEFEYEKDGAIVAFVLSEHGARVRARRMY
jgi:CubicO group peptidase (beta-lactamase class C family)